MEDRKRLAERIAREEHEHFIQAHTSEIEELQRLYAEVKVMVDELEQRIVRLEYGEQSA